MFEADRWVAKPACYARLTVGFPQILNHTRARSQLPQPATMRSAALVLIFDAVLLFAG